MRLPYTVYGRNRDGIQVRCVQVLPMVPVGVLTAVMGRYFQEVQVARPRLTPEAHGRTEPENFHLAVRYSAVSQWGVLDSDSFGKSLDSILPSPVPPSSRA